MVRRLLYLNGLAVLGVILYHASAWGFIAMFWWTDRYRSVSVPNFDQLGSISYFALRLVEQLIIFSIPSFLFVSGFFISIATGKYQETIGWNVIFARIKTLVIPFLIWSAIILGLKRLQGQAFSPLGMLDMIFTGQVEPPYYYVPVLVQLYLISPLLVPLARVRWRPVLVIAALVQILAVGLRYTPILQIYFPGREILLLLLRIGSSRHTYSSSFLAWLPVSSCRSSSVGCSATAGSFWVVCSCFSCWEWPSGRHSCLVRVSRGSLPQETIIDNMYAGHVLAHLSGV